MMTTAEPIQWVKHATTCGRCGKQLVLNQDPECPALMIEKWLPLIVCERCGNYLKEYIRIDDALARHCIEWSITKRPADDVRPVLVTLTQQANRLFCRHWNTQFEWSNEWVDLLLEQPDKSRMSMRWQEKSHRKAREDADRTESAAGTLEVCAGEVEELVGLRSWWGKE